MGDPFELQPDAYITPLRRLAQRILTDAGRADDAIQEAWLAALHKRPDQQDLAWWLASAVRRSALGLRRDEARRREREVRAARPEALPDSSEGAERLEIAGKLVAAVERLEEPYRQAVLMRFFEDLPPRAIAKRLQVPVNTVRTHLRRAIDKLHCDLRGVIRTDSDRDERRSPLSALIALAGPLPMGSALRLLPRGAQVVGAVMTSVAAAGIVAFLFLEGRTSTGDHDSWEVSSTASGGTLVLETSPPSPQSSPAGDRSRDAVLATWALRGTVAVTPPGSSAAIPLSVRLFDGEPPSGNELDRIDFTSAVDGSFVSAITPPDRHAWILVAAGDTGAYWTRPALAFVPRGEAPPTGLLLEACVVDARVTGIVHDAAGRPVHGARVIASDPTRRLEGGQTATLSDGEGRFSLDLPSSLPSIDLVAGTPDGATAWIEIASLDAGEAREQALLLNPPRALRGRVREPSGRPLVGARIRCPWPMERSTATDVAGFFTIPVPSGISAPVWIEAPGYAPLRVLHTDGERDLDLALSAGVTFRGRVIDAAGRGVDGVTVLALHETSSLSPVLSDPDGRFELAHLPRGRIDLVLRRPDSGVLRTTLDLGHSGDVQGAVFALERSRVLRGRVLDDEGRPVSGARLSWQGDPASSPVGTDPDGVFELPDVPVSATALVASRAGWTRDLLPITAETREVEFTLQPGSVLRGRVLDAETGEPIPAFALRVFDTGGSTERALSKDLAIRSPTGTWSLPCSRPPGTPMAIEVSASGYAPRVVEALETGPSRAAEPTTLALVRSTRLHGRVTSTGDRPVENALVSCVILGPGGVTLSDVGPILTPEDGTFAFDHVPLGLLSLSVWRSGWARQVVGPIEIIDSTPVRRDVVLERGIGLSGHLRDAQGHALAGERVTATQGRFTRTTVTDSRGAFRIDGLTPGAGTIAWEPVRAASFVSPIPANGSRPDAGNDHVESLHGPTLSARDLERSILLSEDADLEVELRPVGGSTLAGWISGPGTPPEVAVVTLTWTGSDSLAAPVFTKRSTFAAWGQFRFEALEPGTYRLEAEATGPDGRWRGAREVHVPEFGALDETLTLAPE